MKPVFIIAEAGVNHNGDFDIALKLCDAAKEAGADAVKFQTWKTENIVSKTACLADYQKKNLQKNKTSQYEMLKNLELTYDNFREIKSYCDSIGIKFLSTPDDEESLDFLIDLGIDIIKIGSGDITNIPLLRKIGNYKKPVILSTGMSNLANVENAITVLNEKDDIDITLLHCTTNYPCPMEEVNLNAMKTLKNAFKYKVGYSDHTAGIEVPIAAVSLGAKIIEKHFTLDKSLQGPDHRASLDLEELKLMITSIRNIEKALGSGIKIPNKSEIKISKAVIKRIVAKKKIREGELLTPENLTIKRTNKGISASFWDFVIGDTAEKDYDIDEAIHFRLKIK